MCRCLEVRCVHVYLVSVCNSAVCIDEIIVLVKCCNLKSQIFK